MELKHVVVVVVTAYVVYSWNPARQSVFRSERKDVYDYVIVGAGSAGSVLASRLTENAGNNVLLLEAGDDDVKYGEVFVPAAPGSLINNPETDWYRKTVTQKDACLSMRDQQCVWPAGKLLGGTSSINCMIYTRGSREDHQYWAEELGCDGWSYEDVLPYYKKAESMNNKDYVTSGYHGDGGPWRITENDQTGLADIFLEAGRQLGFKVGDYNGKEQVNVFSRIQANVYNGVRQSTAEAYLRPAMNRPNLDVVIQAHVTKINFEGKQAVGVDYIKNGQKFVVRAIREVIVSAGTVGSAHTLLLSGIGPKEHLTDMNIPVVADLPVGSRIQDHLVVTAPQFVFNDPVAVTLETLSSIKERLKYVIHGTGHLAGNCQAIAVGFSRAKDQPGAHKFSYIQFIAAGLVFSNSPEIAQGFSDSLNIDVDTFLSAYSNMTGRHGITIMPMLLHPKSYGTLRLKSTDPFEYPLIDPKYLSHDQDIKILTEGIRTAYEILNTNVFKEIGGQLHRQHNPSCTSHKYDTDSYWECVIRNMAASFFHQTGSCRMGRADDPEAVVDLQLKVKGLDGLRVVDASVMPEVPSSNTNGTLVKH